MSTIRKSNRNPHDGIRALLVKKLATEYKCSEVYVRISINGKADNEKARHIKDQYDTEYAQITELTHPKN